MWNRQTRERTIERRRDTNWRHAGDGPGEWVAGDGDISRLGSALAVQRGPRGHQPIWGGTGSKSRVAEGQHGMEGDPLLLKQREGQHRGDSVFQLRGRLNTGDDVDEAADAAADGNALGKLGAY